MQAYSRYQYVPVTFGAANTDLVVEHSLAPSVPDTVHYQVLQADRACRVYHDQSLTRRSWAAGYVVLRNDTANAVVTLLLTLPTET